MSDGANPSPQPPRGSSPGLPSASSSQTNPRAMSAARSAPLAKDERPEDIRKRLKSEGANVALNALSVVKEMVSDFRQQDRFFKYKAFIVGGWLLLSVLTVGVTCGRGGVKTVGDYGAQLLPITRGTLTVKNLSKDTWRDVTVIVRDTRGDEWRASAPDTGPHGVLTVSPKQLVGVGGRLAPSDIIIRGIEMRTSEGKAKLMENGANLTQEAPE